MSCAGCEARREEIDFLRARVLHLESVLAAGTPQGPALLERERQQAGVVADPEHFIGEGGIAMVLIDGKQVPYTEWRRGEDALQAALAGKPIEVPASNGGPT